MNTRPPHRTPLAFTLIELLVVISIIALLIGILLPALGAARGVARASVCLSNIRQVGTAFATYHAESKDKYPASYVYPTANWNGDGNGRPFSWMLNDQVSAGSSATGYVHWSFALLTSGTLGAEGFECPTMQEGGHPATNPAPGQEDPRQTREIVGVDRQVNRIAYAGNEMIIPRNKFNEPGDRQNRFVDAVELRAPSNEIVATEFIDNLEVVMNAGNVSKSHRSLNPLKMLSAPAGQPTTHPLSTIRDTRNTSPTLELPDYDSIIDGDGVHIDDEPMAAVGRHHPGDGGPTGGGNTNFIFADGHGESTSLHSTLKKKQWGERFYSLTGSNVIDYRE